jgi:transglutaminase-like putative cysteine protease
MLAETRARREGDDARSAPHLPSVALAVLAAATFHAATLSLDTPDRALACGAAVACAAAVVASAAWGVARRNWLATAPVLRGTVVVAGALLACGLEVAIRSAVDSGIAPEQVPLVVFRNLVLLLAPWSHLPHSRRVGGLLATFLVVFSCAVTDSPWLQWVVVAFALAGAWWLAASYRESLDRRIVTAHRQRRPHGWLAAVPAGMVMILAAIPVTGHRIRALDGFMPTSGGQDRGSPQATSGVGDGDALVAGLENVRSFAPLDDAPFMTSHEPSLYDLFDDTYSEPRKVERTERAISLPAEINRSAERHDAATARKAGREFSLVRKPARPDRSRIHDTHSRALFHLQGRVPLHLRLESFDRFDGVAWHPEAAADPEAIVPRLAIESVAGRPWLRMESIVWRESYAAPETHAVRVIGLRSNRIPTPNRLVGVHVDRLDRADFFAWAQPGLLQIDRESIPDLLPIHLQSRVEDPRRRGAVPLFIHAGPASYRQYGDDPESREVGELVASWVKGLPVGWPQVERIVTTIRSGHRLDPEYRVPAGCRHAVAEFLLRSRRGPDHLFASATVWALRAAGYPARLVTGFYARPDRFDRGAGHTAVLPEDVHVWVELAVANDHYATLEPTPGYDILGPIPTITERVRETLHAAAAAIANHPAESTLLAVALLLACVFRRRLADLGDDLSSRVFVGRSGRETVLRLVARLDRRCRRVGLPRPRHVTPTRWLLDLAGRGGLAPPPTALAMVDAALYAPTDLTIDRASAASLEELADRVWSWARVRRAAEGERGTAR